MISVRCVAWLSVVKSECMTPSNTLVSTRDTPPADIPARNGGTLRPVRDSASARALVAKRYEKKTRAIREGIARAGEQLPDVNSHNEYDTLVAIAEAHAMHAYDPSARGSQSSFESLLRHGFPAPEREQVSVTVTGVGVDPDMTELLALYRAAKQDNPTLAERGREAVRRVVSGDVADVDE